jgi:hypothetical protein
MHCPHLRTFQISKKTQSPSETKNIGSINLPVVLILIRRHKPALTLPHIRYLLRNLFKYAERFKHQCKQYSTLAQQAGMPP